jgi:tRNA A-37 threonylcarbamoyl transferase component Bud32
MVQHFPAGAAQDPLVGQVLSQRYRILAKLGEGAMAAVYLAEHTGVGATIVLKVLLPDLASEPLVVESFLREARIASQIHHDNVIDIFYSGRSPEGHVFLAMEYVPGPTLFDLLAKEGPLSWSRAQPILRQIAGALEAAHRHGVVHRDVKPENVLVGQKDTPEGRIDFVKVVDFGIANTRGDTSSSVCGTPEFMSPEQAQGLPPEPRDDIYGFGCLMYQVLTGDVPFRADDMPEVLLKHLSDPVVPPRMRRPDLEIPAAAQTIVMCALEKKREDRWQDMGEVQKMLEGVTVEPAPAPELAPEAPLAPARIPPAPKAAGRARLELPTETSPRRKRLPTVIGAVLVLLGCGAALVRHVMSRAPGRMEIVTEPAEAEIYVDGQKMADRSPMFLDASPGPYTVMVRRPGFETFTRVFEMKPKLTERIPITLTVLPGPKPVPGRSRPGSAAATTAGEPRASRRRAAPLPAVNGVTFIDFKKAAAAQH